MSRSSNRRNRLIRCRTTCSIDDMWLSALCCMNTLRLFGPRIIHILLLKLKWVKRKFKKKTVWFKQFFYKDRLLVLMSVDTLERRRRLYFTICHCFIKSCMALLICPWTLISETQPLLETQEDIISNSEKNCVNLMLLNFSLEIASVMFGIL